MRRPALARFHPIFSQTLLKTLVICGAKRCPHTKGGCVSGCVNERSVRFLSKSSFSADKLGAPSPRSLAAIEEIEHRDEQSDHPWNKLQEKEHSVSAVPTQVIDRRLRSSTRRCWPS